MNEVIEAQRNLIEKQDELIACMTRQVQIRNEMIQSYQNIIEMLKEKIVILSRMNQS